MSRALVKSLGRFQTAFRHHGAKRMLLNANSGTSHDIRYNIDMCKCCHSSYMFSRALSVDAAAKVTYEEVKRVGPLVEYERRINAGELEDGDNCQSSISPVKGLYLYGGVGTGKTMLMDLFFDQLPCNWRKKRIHFHDFMLNVHTRLQRHKGVSDPLEVVAGEISHESILLCLDEFMVNDVADALILNRLFKHLFCNGAERCIVHEIGSSVDYRRRTSAEEGFYFIQNGTSGFLMHRFNELIGEHTAHPQEAEVLMGRTLQVPLGGNGCAYFPFEELCDKPLGAADYFGLCKNFHTVALDGVPIFGLHNRTAAYRFVTLVDVMYENKARLVCTAEGTPFDLFERIVTVADAHNIAPRTSSRSRKNDDFDLCVDN
ncbi:ATPase, AFG1-like protein, partial [Cynara cardunculus var. scolymus]